MFSPPNNRGMRVLDRSLFKQEQIITSARALKMERIMDALKMLKQNNDLLQQPRIKNIFPDPSLTGEVSKRRRVILLRPGIVHDDRGTWSKAVDQLVNDGDIDLIPYKLELDYENYDRNSIMASVLPDELQEDIPNNYNHAGHVAQLALRPQYLPYKYLIGQVFLDNAPGIRTVINKVGTLDDEEDNRFRTLQYELIAGEDDMNVEAKEQDAIFRFDYSKVFWNSKLSTEHERLVAKFQPGEVICDAMAGVGPFAIPAARKGVFVWASDLNPDCYSTLVKTISLNKVTDFVTAFSEDGHVFIPAAAQALLATTKRFGKVSKRISNAEAKRRKLTGEDLYETLQQPRTFNHYIMNLPSTAMDFLPAFIGLYAGRESLFSPTPGEERKLPMIHCYCFVKSPAESVRPPDAEDENVRVGVCARISDKLGHQIRHTDPEIEIFNVRDVAPQKCHFRVSFRLPPEVAFRSPLPDRVILGGIGVE